MSAVFDSKNIVPYINVNKLTTSGVAPFTIHVDAHFSSLDGLLTNEVEYRWDFGDPHPPTFGKNRYGIYQYGCPADMQLAVRPVLDNRTDNVNRLYHSGNLNVQHGFTAAYTYWHDNGGQPFEIKLGIIHQGQVVATTSGTFINVVEPNDIHATGWITKLITTNVPGSTTGHFRHLNEAVDWVNNNRPAGKIRLLFNNSVGSDYRSALTSGVYLNVPDVMIGTSGNVSHCTLYASSGYPTGIETRWPMLTIGPNADRIHISNITFGSATGALSDPSGYNQGNPLTSKLCGIRMENASEDITIQGCHFQNLVHNIITEDSTSQVFINNCTSDRTGSGCFIFRGGMITFIGNRLIPTSTSSFPMVMNTGWVIELGTSGFTKEDFSFSWNELEANRGSSTNDLGVILINEGRHVFINENAIIGGNIQVGNSEEVQISKNIITDGGINPLIFVKNQSLGCQINNNVFFLNGDGAATQTCFAIDQELGYIDGGSLSHNTFVLPSDKRLTNYEVDFGTHASTNNFYFCNNLFVENYALHLNYLVHFSTNYSGFFCASGNCYPEREDSTRFIRVNNTDLTWPQYLTLGFEGYHPRNNIYPLDFHRLFKYKVDTVRNTGITLSSDNYYYFINTDINGQPTPTGNIYTPGAAMSTGLIYPSTGLFSVSYTASTRSRPTGIAGWTYLFNIDDLTTKVYDISGSLSNKKVLGRNAGLSYLNTLFSGVGDFIYTTGTFTAVANGFDMALSYINDGPAIQTTGVKNALGSMYLEGFNLGRFINVVRDNAHVSYNSYGDSLDGNYFGEALEYPATRFAPCFPYFGDEYAVSINVLHNFKQSKRAIKHFAFRALANNPIVSTLSFSDNNGFNPSGLYLASSGDRLDFTLSVRVSKSPNKWWELLKPYKDYFRSTYGSGIYFKDLRPIVGFNSVAGSSGLKYSSTQYDPSYNASGWNAWANFVDTLKVKGYNRIRAWALAGQYASGSLNYPFLVTTPFYTNKFPHNQYPALTGTLSALANKNLEISDSCMYWGHVLSVVTGWNPTVDTDLNPSTDDLSLVYNEADLSVYNLKFNSLGLDTIGGLFITDQIVTAELFSNRYPDVKIVLEPSVCDFMSNYGSVYTDLQSFSFHRVMGPQYFKDYICPNNELECWINNSTYWSNWGVAGGTVNSDYLSQYKFLSNCGYSVGNYDIMVLASGNSNNQLAKRTEWFVSDKPAEPGSLSSPEITAVTYNNLLNSTFNINKRYIKLDWLENTEIDFSHYIIYKSKIINGVPQGFDTQEVGYTTETEWYDVSVDLDNIYYYRIAAVDVYGNISYSNYLSASLEEGGEIVVINIYNPLIYRVGTISKFGALFIKR